MKNNPSHGGALLPSLFQLDPVRNIAPLAKSFPCWQLLEDLQFAYLSKEPVLSFELQKRCELHLPEAKQTSTR